ncbi:MAG: hypothetical protein WDZ54_06675, partial [Sneathiella sp.]
MTDVQDKTADDPSTDEESTPRAYGLSDEIVQEIQGAIEREDAAFIHEQIEDWHSADTADLIEQLKPKLRVPFLQIMKGRLDPDVYSDLDE